METKCISVQALYEKYGEQLTNVKIDYISKGEENPDCDYYDLYDRYGQLVCMDGEVCEVVSHENGVWTLINSDGEYDIEFELTDEEMEIACFDKED